MKAYFDSEIGNLTDLDRDIARVDTKNLMHHLNSVSLTPTITTNYSEQGVYIVTMTGFVENWSGFKGPDHLRHILYEVPYKVVKAAQERRVIIALISQAEGCPLERKGVNGYKEMHQAMNNLKLPPGSVLLVDANINTGLDYDIWRAEHNEIRMFEHLHFLTCFYYFYNRIPETPLVLSALSNPRSKDFNCLNRTVRQHRLDLIYKMISDDIHTKGLVSGNYANLKHRKLEKEFVPTYVNVDYNTYAETLMKTCPLLVDGEWYNGDPDSSDTSIFNHEIYSNSLLSFVTETAFNDRGMFITEKVFKSIVAGHPFIVLGQPGYLEALEDLGYKVDFEGIDRRYDRIKNPYDRFNAAYDELKKWLAVPRYDKIKMISSSLKNIVDNQELFKTKNYVLSSYEQLEVKLKEMFEKYGQS